MRQTQLPAATLAAALLAAPAAAQTSAYAPHGNPEACGGYEEASLGNGQWFPGGEGGLIQLNNMVEVREMNAALFDATIVEEGMAEPAGRILFASVLYEGEARLLVVYGDGRMEIYLRC